MAGTRSSMRQNQNSSPQSEKSADGNKRKAEDSSPAGTKAKRGRPSKQQKTLEETIAPTDETNTAEYAEVPDVEADGPETKDAEMDDAEANGEEHKEEAKAEDGETAEEAKDAVPEDDSKNAFDQVKADDNDQGTTSKEENKEDAGAPSDDVKADAVEEDKKRDDAMPSNILEKGIIYFFTRGRVGVEDPDSVQDLQRSYFVLRPLPDGAKITDGAIQDVGNNRLCALPKKVWPKSPRDRFMVFVEKAKTTMDTLKEEFFQGSEYSTKTTGTRHTPEVTPLGEGVYAITSTGGGRGTTHLAYMLTIPTELGEVQKDVGLAAKGSFVISLKNPESSQPANAQLPQGPGYPKKFIEEFGGRGWGPVQPKYLDYANAQMLLIGENFDSSANLEPTAKDEKDDAKKTPQEELEQLEEEDESRIEHLKGDDAIFADLGISSKDYPKVMTTW
ncbi:hypothetical protein LTR37_018357 [Vermiconidia calcicola]|uniref:Uncharacterized protein n=1 Tax=Vermiconidia calcicola TaxID=1690605 RepID=A0ACC3MHK0_9PEZI|nr:hypothetical protein LTR37_018357 [Vermiconidia calcicola]